MEMSNKMRYGSAIVETFGSVEEDKDVILLNRKNFRAVLVMPVNGIVKE
tara:strand:+ start:504 stop:650 length:147 start_codon:yes stop_codon:yes gene_type:complete